jgi:hypothetical protein
MTTDYMAILVSLFGTGNVFLLSFVLFVAIYGAINGVRGEIMKFFIFMLLIGLSFLTTTFVTTLTVVTFCFYYGKKIYKGIQKS